MLYIIFYYSLCIHILIYCYTPLENGLLTHLVILVALLVSVYKFGHYCYYLFIDKSLDTKYLVYIIFRRLL